MRLSSLSLAAVFLFSSTVFAQRHEASAPSSPPSSPPQSAAPSQPPAPAPAPAPPAAAAPSSAPSASASRGSESSTPAPARTPENHVEPGAVQSFSHTSSGTFTQSTPVAPSAREPASGAERVIPDERIAAQDKITPAARIGEVPEKAGGAKPGESDLRHKICEGGPCKEPAPKSAAESDLRHPVCPGGVCRCPAGQSLGKSGCVAAQPPYQPASQCGRNELWNGGSCVPQGIDCANLTARAEGLLGELRSLAVEVRDACSNDPASSECNDAKARYDAALQRYRMLQNEATPECRARLQEPPLV